MIKALLLDIDNTLLTPDGQLTDDTKAAVALATERGLAVILATARGYRSTRPIHRELGLKTPAVCHAGAMVYDYAEEKALKTWPLDAAAARTLAHWATAAGIRISAYIDEEVWFNRLPGEPLRADWRLKADLAQKLSEHRALSMVITETWAVEEAVNFITTTPLQHLVVWDRLEEAGREWLFISRPGTNKIQGLSWLLEELGLTWQDAAACGDGLADIAMIKQARWGLAAPFALPAVRAVAQAPFILPEDEPIPTLVQEILLRCGIKN